MCINKLTKCAVQPVFRQWCCVIPVVADCPLRKKNFPITEGLWRECSVTHRMYNFGDPGSVRAVNLSPCVILQIKISVMHWTIQVKMGGGSERKGGTTRAGGTRGMRRG